MPLLYPIAFHCRPYQKPTLALYARSGLAILWPREEGPRAALRWMPKRGRGGAPMLPAPHRGRRSPTACPKAPTRAPVPGLGRLSSPHSLSLHICSSSSTSTHPPPHTCPPTCPPTWTHQCLLTPPPQAGLSWLPCSLKHEQRECTASDPFEVYPLNAAPKHTPLSKTPP